MADIIVDGATLKCNKGTKTSKFMVTSQHFTYIDDKLVATEKDIEPIRNIPSFGNCKCVWYQPACVPQPQIWENTTNVDSINEMRKLTLESTCRCSKGGIISIVDTGANSHVDSE